MPRNKDILYDKRQPTPETEQFMSLKPRVKMEKQKFRKLKRKEEPFSHEDVIAPEAESFPSTHRPCGLLQPAKLEVVAWA